MSQCVTCGIRLIYLKSGKRARPATCEESTALTEGKARRHNSHGRCTRCDSRLRRRRHGLSTREVSRGELLDELASAEVMSMSVDDVRESLGMSVEAFRVALKRADASI